LVSLQDIICLDSYDTGLFNFLSQIRQVGYPTSGHVIRAKEEVGLCSERRTGERSGNN